MFTVINMFTRLAYTLSYTRTMMLVNYQHDNGLLSRYGVSLDPAPPPIDLLSYVYRY